MGQKIAFNMQDRWWKHELENYRKTIGNDIQIESQAIGQEYSQRIKEAGGVKDPFERSAAMNDAHSWAIEQTGILEMKVLNSTIEYHNNPYIGQIANSVLIGRQKQNQALLGIPEKTAKEAEGLYGTVLDERQASATERQAAASEKQAEASMISAEAQAAKQEKPSVEEVLEGLDRVPKSKRADWLMLKPGGVDLIESQSKIIQDEDTAEFYKAYIDWSKLDEGEAKNKLGSSIKKEFGLDPIDFYLAEKKDEVEVLISKWTRSRIPIHRELAADRIARMYSAREEHLFPSEEVEEEVIPERARGVRLLPGKLEKRAQTVEERVDVAYSGERSQRLSEIYQRIKDIDILRGAGNLTKKEKEEIVAQRKNLSKEMIELETERGYEGLKSLFKKITGGKDKSEIEELKSRYLGQGPLYTRSLSVDIDNINKSVESFAKAIDPEFTSLGSIPTPSDFNEVLKEMGGTSYKAKTKSKAKAMPVEKKKMFEDELSRAVLEVYINLDPNIEDREKIIATNLIYLASQWSKANNGKVIDPYKLVEWAVNFYKEKEK